MDSILAYLTPEQTAFIIAFPVMLWIGHFVMFAVLGLGKGDREFMKYGLAVGLTVISAGLIPGLLPQRNLLTALCAVIGYIFIIAGYRHILMPLRAHEKKIKAA